MKQFFEQYGGIALGILALLVLIAMITPMGNIIKTSLQGTVDTFSTKINNQTGTMAESMNIAFINATDFTGIKDGKFYQHGQINSFLKDYTFLSGTTLIKNGKNYFMDTDINFIIDGVGVRSIPGYFFDLYIDDTLRAENVNDFCSIAFDFENSKEIKIVKKQNSNNYQLEDLYIFKPEDFTFYLNDTKARIRIDITIRTYSN